MKTLLLSLTYAVGIGELILAVYFWVTNSKNEIRRVMALLAFSTGMWVILSAITTYVSFSTIGYYEMAAVYFFGILLITSILHLVLIMPYPFMSLDRFHKMFLYSPLIFFGCALFFTRTVLVEFTGGPDNIGTIIGGPLFIFYNIYLSLLFISSGIVLMVRIKKLSGMHRINAIIVLWSLILGGLPGTIMYLIIPIFYGYLPYNTLAFNLPTILWVGGTWFVINRRGNQ